MPHILQSPMECALAEMKETNRHLQLLTQNLSGLTVDPLSGFQLGDGVPVGKRPFYADRTISCGTRDHTGTPIIFFDPSRNTWKAISWAIFNANTDNTIVFYKDTRVGGGLPVPTFAALLDGVICDKRVLYLGLLDGDVMFPINLFPAAFVMAKDEVLWLATSGGVGPGIVNVVFGFTLGDF